MSNHTPGPWAFDETWYLIYGPKGGEVAAIHAGEAGSQRFHREQALANAALIAAAPELLGALEKFLAAAKCNYDPKVMLAEFGAEAEAAVAKAKGAT